MTEDSTAKYVIYQGDNEWSALYVDGTLDRVGDHYLVDERLRELLGVETVQSDDFMRGGDSREHVAPTLHDLYLWSENRDALHREAQALREQAAALEAQAVALVNRG